MQLKSSYTAKETISCEKKAHQVDEFVSYTTDGEWISRICKKKKNKTKKLYKLKKIIQAMIQPISFQK